MKTPEEIKRGLAFCGCVENEKAEMCGDGCPYNVEGEFCCNLMYMLRDAHAYILQLEDTVSQRDSLLAALGVTVPKEG